MQTMQRRDDVKEQRPDTSTNEEDTIMSHHLQSYTIHILDPSTPHLVTKTLHFSHTDMDSSSAKIYSDDTIHTIKLKISKALHLGDNIPYPSPETMYLFSRIFIPSSAFTIESIHNEITKNDTRELTKSRIEVFLHNHSLAMSVSEPFPKFLEEIQDHIINSRIHGVLRYIPLGFQSHKPDVIFPINPFFKLSNEVDIGTIHDSTILVPFETQPIISCFMTEFNCFPV